MSRPFARRFDGPRLTPEQAQRQGAASKLAVQMLANSGEVIAFLNTHDEALGGRPLDIAVESAEGLARVESSLRARTAA